MAIQGNPMLNHTSGTLLPYDKMVFVVICLHLVIYLYVIVITNELNILIFTFQDIIDLPQTEIVTKFFLQREEDKKIEEEG